jgi:hypothetical protein
MVAICWHHIRTAYVHPRCRAPDIMLHGWRSQAATVAPSRFLDRPTGATPGRNKTSTKPAAAATAAAHCHLQDSLAGIVTNLDSMGRNLAGMGAIFQQVNQSRWRREGVVFLHVTACLLIYDGMLFHAVLFTCTLIPGAHTVLSGS